jgi:hypothetical protein
MNDSYKAFGKDDFTFNHRHLYIIVFIHQDEIRKFSFFNTAGITGNSQINGSIQTAAAPGFSSEAPVFCVKLRKALFMVRALPARLPLDNRRLVPFSLTMTLSLSVNG